MIFFISSLLDSSETMTDTWTTDVKDGRNYVYYSNGKGGWGCCLFGLGNGYIYFISVYPHNQKIGTIVMTDVEDRLRKYGHRFVKLAPLPDVVEFYKKRGYYQSWWDIWRPHVWRKRL